MQKKLNRFFNLRINSRGAAFENLNIGPNLSPYMNREKIKEFCNEFNKQTFIYRSEDLLIYVRLFLYTDKSFVFLIKGPSFSTLLKLVWNIMSLTNKNIMENSITLRSLYDIVILRNYYWFKLYNNLNQNWIKLRFKNSFFSISNLQINKII